VGRLERARQPAHLDGARVVGDRPELEGHLSFHFSGGIHYRPDDDWLLQAGITFDTSPVDEDDRTPDMPIDRRIRYAVGAQYQWADDINVGASFVFIDMGDAEIDRSFLKGEYSENYLVFFGLNLGWKF
jgi:long-chain fatty acid transport protein